jgi:hypothetical protein
MEGSRPAGVEPHVKSNRCSARAAGPSGPCDRCAKLRFVCPRGPWGLHRPTSCANVCRCCFPTPLKSTTYLSDQGRRWRCRPRNARRRRADPSLFRRCPHIEVQRCVDILRPKIPPIRSVNSIVARLTSSRERRFMRQNTCRGRPTFLANQTSCSAWIRQALRRDGKRCPASSTPF